MLLPSHDVPWTRDIPHATAISIALSFQHENVRSKDAFLAKPKGAPKDKLSYYRVAPYYYFQVSSAATTAGDIMARRAHYCSFSSPASRVPHSWTGSSSQRLYSRTLFCSQ